jgi:hypothetical protein
MGTTWRVRYYNGKTLLGIMELIDDNAFRAKSTIYYRRPEGTDRIITLTPDGRKLLRARKAKWRRME